MIPGLDTALAELGKKEDFLTVSPGKHRESFTLESFCLLAFQLLSDLPSVLAVSKSSGPGLLPCGLSASQWKWLLESAFSLAPSAHHSSACSCFHSLPKATPQGHLRKSGFTGICASLPTRYYYSYRKKLEWV